MKKYLPLLFLTLACSAEDWTLVSGKTYRDVRVTGKDAVTVEFSHSGGAARADFMHIPEAARKSLGFSARAYSEAKEAAGEAAAKEALNRKDEAKSIALSGKILQVANDGFLSTASGLQSGMAYSSKALKGVPRQGNFWITGHPDQGKLVDDQVFVVSAIETGVHTYETALGAKATVKSFRVTKVHQRDGVTGRIMTRPTAK